MADFYGDDRREYASFDAFALRYAGAEDIAGYAIWREWVLDERWRSEPEAALAELIERLAVLSMQRTCPRVFVSHRQHDVDEAKRIAFLANQQGFEFWLDVFDPNLQRLAAGSSLPPAAHAALIASIIEMALLNCTHVIAALTNQTRGTLWVPYEYGRVKERTRRSRRTGVWLHPKIAPADIPEYTVLGVTTRTEVEIDHWLVGEMHAWVSQMNSCHGGAGNGWRGGPTTSLPR